ncbi:MAG: SprB repeat-containing protein, partial [Bacteroidota bacterium]
MKTLYGAVLLSLLLLTFGINSAAAKEAKPMCINITSFDVQDETCGRGDGSISVTHDGTAPFTYQWTGTNANGASATNLSAGTYTVRITDDAGCDAERTFVVGNVDPLVLDIQVQGDLCQAGTGAASASVIFGGTPPFTYQWDDSARNQTSATATDLLGGTYVLIVTDPSGCRVVDTVIVPVENDLVIDSINITDATCWQGTDGSAEIFVSGGNGSYVYDWDPEVTTSSAADNLGAASFTVIINDASGPGCETEVSFEVEEGDRIFSNMVTNRSSDCGVADGFAFVNPIGGAGEFTFSWDVGVTPFPDNDTVLGLAPGIYSMVITDTLDCSITTRFVIESEDDMEVDAIVLREDICGLSQGIARARVTGANRPIIYNWFTDPGQPDTSQFAYNLRQGNWDIVVSDQNGCFEQLFFTITGNPPVEVLQSRTNDDYCDLATGSATVIFGGGTPPFSYEWSSTPPQTSLTARNLAAGPYRVVARDANGCPDTANVVVGTEDGFTLETETEGIICFGDRNGRASAIIDGGFSPFNYNWSSDPPQGGSEANGLPEGTYNVTVIDSRGCEREAFAIIDNAPTLIANFATTPDTATRIALNEATFAFDNFSVGAETYNWE